MYFDDTTLSCCIDSMNPDDRDQIINDELNLVNNWMLANKLKLNSKKTKYMLFHKSTKSISDLNFKINNNHIARLQLSTF